MEKSNECILETRDELFMFEDYSILMQALGLGHTIVVDNGLAKIKVFMDKDYNLKGLNLNFPDLPPYNYNEEMTFSNVILGVIPELKKQPAADFPGRFESRWDELKAQTLDAVAFNKMKDRIECTC